MDLSERRTRARVLVSGRVQGVYFRSATQQKAVSLGLTGWVRNLPDGRVETLFEGKTEAVGRAVAWCRHGPPAAEVENVAVSIEEPTGEFSSFRITW